MLLGMLSLVPGNFVKSAKERQLPQLNSEREHQGVRVAF